jgi:23S rRNA A1618 N6-methylase RlmF
VDGILRSVLLRQSSESLRESVVWIMESVRQSDSLGDLAEKLEECLAALRNVVEVEKSLTQ